MFLTIWSIRRTPRSARCFWFGLGCWPVMILISRFTVTERERIARLCWTMAGEVEQGAVDSIAGRLTADFESQGLDREAFTARMADTLSRNRVDDVALRRVNVVLPDDDEAEAELHATCMVQSADLPYELFVSDWRVHFRRQNHEWKVRGIELLAGPGNARIGIRDLLP